MQKIVFCRPITSWLFLNTSFRYSANYVNEVKMSDMSMRPNASTGSKGKTYRFYEGRVVWPFGFGLSYSTFDFVFSSTGMPSSSISASQLLQGQVKFPVVVSNNGTVDSAVAVQLYVRTPDISDAPLSTLVRYSMHFICFQGWRNGLMLVVATQQHVFSLLPELSHQNYARLLLRKWRLLLAHTPP